MVVMLIKWDITEEQTAMLFDMPLRWYYKRKKDEQVRIHRDAFASLNFLISGSGNSRYFTSF